MADTQVVNNESAHRFEIAVDGKLGILQYRLRPDAIVFTHAEVPPEFEGRGFGGRLARAGLEFARSKQLYAIPACPFIAAYVQRHQEYLDLVPLEQRERLLAG